MKLTIRQAAFYVGPLLLGIGAGALADIALHGELGDLIAAHRVYLDLAEVAITTAAVAGCVWFHAQAAHARQVIIRLNAVIDGQCRRIAARDAEPTKVINLDSRRGAR